MVSTSGKNWACVWQPKYKTQEVLVNINSVVDGKCYVFFSSDKERTNLYSYDGTKVIELNKVQQNGKGYCYVFPLSWLNDAGELPEKYETVRTVCNENFKRYYASRW